MHSSGHVIHEWLSEETEKWTRLGEALYDVCCFVKKPKTKKTLAISLR